MTSGMNMLERFGQALMMVSAWPGRVASWFVLPMMLAVLLVVIGSMMRIQELFGWGSPIPLFGNNLSINGLGELQWHLFAVMVMLSGAYAMAEDRHVRVDLLYAKFSPCGKAVVDIVGDAVLLLPFCVIVGWLSLGYVNLAYISGEQSDYGGLSDRYLVKAILPIGLGLLFAAGLGRIVRNVGVLLNRVQVNRQSGDASHG